MMPLRIMFWMIALWMGLVFLVESVAAPTDRVPALRVSASTNALKPDQALGRIVTTNSSATNGSEPVSFDTLAAFPIKVDWLINPTNSSLDTLKQEGEITDKIKLLHGKHVTLQGFMKPLKQDAGGVVEFLLMRDHALCCQEKVPKINEWVHVRVAGKGFLYVHERLLTVRGVLQVGALLGPGNVVSVYRLTDAEMIGPSLAH